MDNESSIEPTPPPVAPPASPIEVAEPAGPKQATIDDLPEVGFPSWVKLAALIAVLLVLLSLIRIPKALGASISAAKGEKYFDAGQFDQAAEAYKRAEKDFPDSEKVILPLADAYLRADRPVESARELEKLQGRELDDDEMKRANAIASQLDRIADEIEKEQSAQGKPKAGKK